MAYDVFQQVFTLSQISNVLFSSKGTQAQLQAEAEAALKFYLTFQGGTDTPSAEVTDLIGDWTLVWGPVVWKNKTDDAKTGPGNTILVAYKPGVQFSDSVTLDTYVVAIAGTAMTSTFDIVDEDFAVSSVVQFTDWLAAKGWSTTAAPPAPSPQGLAIAGHTYLDNGTAQGVYQLLANTPPSTAVNSGTYLADFLSGLPSSAAVVFTGHSLGGALAPTLATVMQQKGWLPSYGASNGGVYVYPTAGASPGNPNFAALYNATFKIPEGSPTVGTSYQIWNAVLWNTLDVVPHAWAVQKYAIDGRCLNAIPGLYGNVPPLKDVSAAVDTAIGKAAVTTCHFTPLQGNPFPGVYSVNVTSLKTGDAVTISQPPANFDEFFDELLYQHIAYYSTYTGIDLPKPAGATAAPPVVETV